MLSRLAYQDGAEIKRVTGELGLNTCQFMEDKRTDTQVFCAIDRDVMVISFRGTTTIKDWLTDASMRRTEFTLSQKNHTGTAFLSHEDVPTFNYGMVHRGFKNALAAVWDQIRSFLNRYHINQRIFITGHSLGAALGTLLAARLEFYGYNMCALYTFGSPRVGNRVFARVFNERVRHYRFQNNNDTVTRVPLPFRYKHTGFRYYFNARGEFVTIGLIGILLDRLLGRCLSLRTIFKGTDGIKDHFMTSYDPKVIWNAEVRKR